MRFFNSTAQQPVCVPTLIEITFKHAFRLLGLLLCGTCAYSEHAAARHAGPPPLPPEETSYAELIAQYRERCERVIDEEIAITDPNDSTRGSFFTVAANLARGENLPWASQRLVAGNQPPTGSMFWMHPMVLLMECGRGVLGEEDWQSIRELWRTYFPYRGDTENHWVMYYASIYLAAEMFPDAGPEAWYNGKSSAENMAEAKEFIKDWVAITTAYGQGEYDSPNYIEEYTRPMALLAGWAQDAEMRMLGKMMMDYVLLDYVVESLDGLYGGAHSRLYPRYALQPALTAGAAHGWLFFGQGEFRRNSGNTLIALSGYTPPEILFRIAHGRDEAYIHRELKRTRWQLRNAGEDSFEIDEKTTSPVYKYSYVHPDYILGSSQGGILQPIQQQTWSLLWREDNPQGKSNTMFGLQPYSSPHEGTMFFSADWDVVTDIIARSKVDYDSEDKLEGGSPYEQVFQHESTLIALYDMPEDTRFPLIHTLFSRDLENREIDPSGWIFAKGGPTFLAYYPLAKWEWKDVDWTGLLKSGAGGFFSTNFAELAGGSQSLVSRSLHNGYVLQVAPASIYESYAEFKGAILALRLEAKLEPVPTVSFESLDGVTLTASYGELPLVNGEPVDYASWPLFDGPYSQAERGSKAVTIKYGQDRYLLDFNKPGTQATVTEDSP